jgi:hypothetical protein
LTNVWMTDQSKTKVKIQHGYEWKHCPKFWGGSVVWEPELLFYLVLHCYFSFYLDGLILASLNIMSKYDKICTPWNSSYIVINSLNLEKKTDLI